MIVLKGMDQPTVQNCIYVKLHERLPKHIANSNILLFKNIANSNTLVSEKQEF